MKGYEKAGVLALIAKIIGVLSIVIPSNRAGYFVGPLSVFLSFVCGYRGRFGSERDKNWVESNF
jgi:hypothetical protein